MTQTIDDIPSDEIRRIRDRVLATVGDMRDEELRIVASSESAFALFIAEFFRDIAQLIGYIIAIPLAWAENIVDSIGEGLSHGFREGYKRHRVKSTRS